MAGINPIKDKILADAKAQAVAMVEEAKNKAYEATKVAELKDLKQAKALEDKAKSEAEITYKRMISMAELKVRQEELQLKQDLIQKAFELASEKLTKLPKKEYLHLVQTMLLSSVESGQEEVILAGLYQKDVEELIQKINQEKNYKLTISKEKRELDGGFILKSGNIELNNSFRSILHANKEAWTLSVAEILFQN